ncbi:MAG: hypothetical protein QY307_00455 [Acidimicrobiia bacterium]|nr:MAG: hypothetical protein QY307_00455 [Acidimicrobiia bacterium]
MEKYEVLEFVHILFATVWVGGAVIAAVLGSRLRNADPAHRLGTTRDLEFMGNVFGASAMVTLAFGIWMVIDSPTWAFGDTWVVIGLAAIGLSTILGAVLISGATRSAIKEMEAGGAAEAHHRKIGLYSALDMAVLLIAVWAMVFKPGA